MRRLLLFLVQLWYCSSEPVAVMQKRSAIQRVVDYTVSWADRMKAFKGLVSFKLNRKKIVMSMMRQLRLGWRVGRKVILDSYFSWSLVGLLAAYLGIVFLRDAIIGGTLGISAGLLYAFIDYINRVYERFKPLECPCLVSNNRWLRVTCLKLMDRQKSRRAKDVSG